VAYCGIDPGLEKFGLAIADGPAGERLVFSAIMPVEKTDFAIECILKGTLDDLSAWETEPREDDRGFSLDEIYLGNGTGFKFFKKRLEERGISYTVVREHSTTIEGRALYWKLHPPSGLWKIIPLSLRVPPRQMDDLAAWAILRRAMIEK
jgi:hypothetical protein